MNSLIEKLRGGDRRSLARAITLVESRHREDRQKAMDLLEAMPPLPTQSLRIGVSGVPGVGKSTFIESFGLFLIAKGFRVAVLAIDPSSQMTGGSILADKTRMPTLASHKDAFIRPTPSSGSLGGVAVRTRDVMLLCELAGFDVILIETVGVGQSETSIYDLTDLVLLLLAPACGDELQGIKKGIVEIADLILVNKADGDHVSQVDDTAGFYSNALHLLKPRLPCWLPTLHKVSALEGRGFDPVWKDILSYQKSVQESGLWDKRRHIQDRVWFERLLREVIMTRMEEGLQNILPSLAISVEEGSLTPFEALRQAEKDLNF